MGWFFSSDDDKNVDNSAPQNNNTKNNNIQVFQHHSSYSTSRTCHTDPNDDKFMLCTQKRRQHGKQKIVQTRVPVPEQMFSGTGFPSLFSNLFGSFNDSSHIINSRLDQLDKEFAEDFNKIAYSFMPFFTMIDPTINFKNQQEYRNFQNYPYSSQQPRRGKDWQTKNNWEGNHNKNQDQRHYFNSTERDSEIRDL